MQFQSQSSKEECLMLSYQRTSFTQGLASTTLPWNYKSNCLFWFAHWLYSAIWLCAIFSTDSREGCYREPNSSMEETDDGQEGSRASSQGTWGTDAEGGWAETPPGHSPLEETTPSEEGGAWKQEVSCNKRQMDRQINCRVQMLILNCSLFNQYDDRPMASMYILLTVATGN